SGGQGPTGRHRGSRRPPRLHASAPCRSEANWGSKPSSRQLDGLNRVNFGHVSDKTAPLLSFGPAAPNLSGGGSEVQSDRFVSIGGHRLAFDGPPGLAFRKSLVLLRPAFACVASDVHRGLAARADPRPDFRPVHREHPDRVRITGMQDNGEPDIADLLGHIVPDADPPALGALHAINPAVILLIQTVRLQRMQADTMGIVAVLRVGIRPKECKTALVQGTPRLALIRALKDTA